METLISGKTERKEGRREGGGREEGGGEGWRNELREGGRGGGRKGMRDELREGERGLGREEGREGMRERGDEGGNYSNTPNTLDLQSPPSQVFCFELENIRTHLQNAYHFQS